MPSKQERREKFEQDRDEIAAIKSSFHINIDDAIAKIAQKVTGVGGGHSSNAPAGLYDPNVLREERMIAAGVKKPDGPMNQHINWDEFGMKVAPGALRKMAATQQAANNPSEQLRSMLGVPVHHNQNNTLNLALGNRLAEKYSPILQEISGFKFSSVDEKRQAQMEEIINGVKNSIRKLQIREVVANTKNLYANAEKFFQTDKGIRVVYKVADQNVSVTAEGPFAGDEIVCLEPEADGSNVTAYVTRQDGDGFQDITANFSMKMELV